MTGENVLNIALDLLNIRGSDGVLPAGCEDIQSRAVNLINICLSECAPLQARLSDEEWGLSLISALNQNIDYDTTLLVSVIPIGVAAYISTDDDPALAKNLTDRYNLAYRTAMRYSKGKISPITEVY